MLQAKLKLADSPGCLLFLFCADILKFFWSSLLLKLLKWTPELSQSCFRLWGDRGLGLLLHHLSYVNSHFHALNSTKKIKLKT